MADTQVPAQDPAAPAAAPAAGTEERILAIVQQAVQAGIDARIPGLQSAYDRQISSLKTDLQKQLRRASMTDDEAELADRSDLEAQLARERQARLLAEAAIRYPKAAPVYQKLMGFEDVDEQLAYLESLGAASQAQPDAGASDQSTESTPPTPPVDPNNPPRDFSVPAGQMTREIADRLLGSYTRWPGQED